MVMLFTIAASLSLFFALQAGYSFWLAKSKRRDAMVRSRLAIQTEKVESKSSLLSEKSTKGLAGFLDGVLEETGLNRNLLALIDQAGERTSPGQLAAKMLLLALIPSLLLGVLTTSPGIAFIALFIGGIPLLSLAQKRSVRLKKIDAQLPVALEIMMLSLRAGHSMAQTIKLSSTELQDPIRAEFARCSEEHALGRSLDECLMNMSRRLPACRALRTFVVAVLVLQQTGGNLIEVIERIINTLRMQNQYERKLMAMTAEGRNSARMVSSIPPAFLLLGYLSGPEYIGTLFTNPMGQKVLLASVLLWLAGVLWTMRLIRPGS